MELDPIHTEKLKDPRNARDYTLYVPEGITPEPKKKLAELSVEARDLRKFTNRS